MANEVKEPLKLYFHENTAEQASMLNNMVTNVLNDMGITSIQEEVVENAVSDYLTKHPVHDGEKGDKGDTGATPNISASATVSQTVGTPTVSVEKSGTDENPNFSFAFSGIKGEKGDKGDEGLDGFASRLPQAEYNPSDYLVVDDGTRAEKIQLEDLDILGEKNYAKIVNSRKSYGGVTLTSDSNGLFTLNGEASSDQYFGYSLLLVNGTYKVLPYYDNPRMSRDHVYWYIQKKNKATGKDSFVASVTNDNQETLMLNVDDAEDYTYSYVIKTSAGQTFDNEHLHPYLYKVSNVNGVLSNKALSDKIGTINTDKVEIVRERIIYDINHVRVITNVGKLENGVYTLVAPKTGFKWDEYKVYDTDLKSSKGIAKLKIHISEISGTWRFYNIFQNRNNEDVYINGGDLTETGDFVYDIDLNYLSVYQNYRGQGINLIVANRINSTDETTYKIVIDEYSVVTEGITTSGNNLTDVIKNIASGTGTIQSNDNKLSAPNGDKYILQVGNNGALKTIPVIPSNILYIGNSLLIGFGNHGMASTTVEDDYFYKINHWITGQGKTLDITDKLSGGAFEGCTTDEAVNTWITETLAPQMSNDRELVIVQLGDNVNNGERLAEFNQSCGMLLSYIREHCPNARICWLGMWYSSDARLSIIRKNCQKYGCTFVDIHDLSESELYRNHIGATYIDSNGNEQTITESGVASHPNDLGFTEIAKRVVEQLFGGEYM